MPIPSVLDVVISFVGGPEDGRSLRGRDAIHLIRRVTMVGDVPEYLLAGLGHRVEVFRGRGDAAPLAVAHRDLSAVQALFARGVRPPAGVTYELATIDGPNFTYRVVEPRPG